MVCNDLMPHPLGQGRSLTEIPAKKFDIFLMNSQTVLHTRKPFVDLDDEEKKRYMVRVWIDEELDAVYKEYRLNRNYSSFT